MTQVVSRPRARTLSVAAATATGIVFEALEPRNMLNADFPDPDTVFEQGFGFWVGGRQLVDYYEGDKHELPGGKFLTVGRRTVDGNDTFTIFRLNPDGTRDQSFGFDGGVSYGVTPEGWQFAGFAMHGHSDGSIIIAGHAWGYDYRGAGDYVSELAVARLKADGSLDTTFGDSGFARTGLAREYYPRGQAIAVQPDGKIVVAGSTYGRDVLTDSDFVVARFNVDGSLDAGFGNGGVACTDYGDFAATEDRAAAVVVAPGGGIVVVGTADRWCLAVARLNADGSPDVAFGADGTLVASLDGRVAAHAGEAFRYPDGSRTAIRLGFDGGFDATFGRGGMAHAPLTMRHDVLIDDQGRVVLLGDVGWDKDRTSGRYYGFFGINPDGRPAGLAAALPAIEAAYETTEPTPDGSSGGGGVGGDDEGAVPVEPETKPIRTSPFSSGGNDRLLAAGDRNQGWSAIIDGLSGSPGEPDEDNDDDEPLMAAA
jgi:uncharacterized delta-60 repeat protein